MKNSTNKKFLYLIPVLLSLFVASAVFAQTTPLTLRKTIDIALKNNSSLHSDSLEISVTDTRNKELAGYMLPQVTYSNTAEFNPAIGTQMIPGSIAGQPGKDYVPIQFGSKYNLRSGFEVTQTLFKKDLQLQIRTSALQSNITRTKYLMSKEALVYAVATTYYALQNNAELIRTTTFDFIILNEVLEIAKAQFEQGTLKKIDYQSLELNVANKESYLNQLKTVYNDQLSYFNYLLGLPASNKTVIEDRISANVDPVDGTQSFLQRKDLRLSNQVIQSKEYEIKRINAERLPTVKSYFRYNYQSQFNEPDNFFEKDYWYDASTLGVSVSLTIFDGNRRRSRLKAANIELHQLKLQNDNQRKKAEMELFSAKGTLNNNQTQYRITQKNLELAEKVFATRKELYREGVTTLMELLDAERELSDARSMYMQAMIDVQTGLLDVHKAKGSLLDDFIKTLQ